MCVFYHIGADFLPAFDEEPDHDSWIYVVNYYGQLSDPWIKAFAEKHPNLIMDHIQAFFQRPVTGVDTVFSCRKYFGVPDGGYAVTKAFLHEELPKDCSMKRMSHLLGRLEGPSADLYYDSFKHNDKMFSELELRSMSELTHNILRGINYDYVKERREANFIELDNELGRSNRLTLSAAGTYMYPFLIENGREIRKKLIEKKIFIPMLWPNVLESKDVSSLERDFAENILPLPIDQRYGKEEMEQILNALISVN